MERVIKFRAWDKKRMVFFSDLTIGIEKRYNNPYVYFKTDTFGGEVRLGTHEVMQFTGLLDKNGKEIYERDIVKDCSHSDMVFDVNFNTDKGGYFMPEGFDENYYWPMADVELEVIGNIYENPDLIK